MSRQLWLLRHGATEWALNGRHTGSTDLPLLPEGEAEARALGPVLSQQTFAVVFSSPLQRAQRTCELAGLGDQMQIFDDIIEWNYGDYEGITTATIRETVPDWTVWSHGCPWPHPPGTGWNMAGTGCHRRTTAKAGHSLRQHPGLGTGNPGYPAMECSIHGELLIHAWIGRS